MNQSLIKKIRVDNGLTQTELARKLGVNQSQVSRWERGVQLVPEWAKLLIECLFIRDGEDGRHNQMQQ